MDKETSSNASTTVLSEACAGGVTISWNPGTPVAHLKHEFLRMEAKRRGTVVPITRSVARTATVVARRRAAAAVISSPPARV